MIFIAGVAGRAGHTSAAALARALACPGAILVIFAYPADIMADGAFHRSHQVAAPDQRHADRRSPANMPARRASVNRRAGAIR
jgi:hypothetical protein